MRIVFWNPQERVDVPDMVAANFLVLGEFRRMSREALLGADENRILRGFAVEASGVPDALITVKMDDGGTLSAALGGENMGSHISHGQLVGGEDDNQNLEGNTQQTLDFTAQPNATYTVQMRFTYAEGVADNRALWDDATDSESTSSVSTRHLPGFELRLSGAPSAEWIDLASVVWGGATITAGNITDLRVFAMEGVTPFQQTTQTGTGGQPNFSRAATRGGSAVGLNAVWPVLRALGRQVQDLKGADDSGNWNWWNYAFQAPGTTSPRAAGITKSLRSVDTVSFTIGNGTETWGDFNGASGLDDCFAHVTANSASLPQRIRILIRDGNTPLTQVITAGLNLTDKHIELIGQEGGSGVRARTFVDVTALTAGQAFLSASGTSGGVTIKNISNLGFALTADAYMVANFDGNAGPTTIENCDLQGDTSAAGTRAVVNVPSSGLRMVNCDIRGRVYIEGASSAIDLKAGEILSCRFLDCGMALTDGAGNTADGLAIRNCQLFPPTTAYTATDFSFALLHAAASQLVIDNCFLRNHGDLNGLHIGTGATKNVTVRGCEFETASGVTHAVDGGTFTTIGTGWQIWCAGSDDTTNAAANVLVDNCFFEGPSDGHRDAGSVLVRGVRSAAIRDCRFREITANATANSRAYGIKVQGIATGGDGAVRIAGCRFEHMSTTGTKDIRAIALDSADHTLIEGCYIDGRDSAGAAIAALAAGAGALRIDDSDYVRVTSNIFELWDTANARCVSIAGTNLAMHIKGNTFLNNAGDAIVVTGGSTTDSGFNENIIKSIVAASGGIDVGAAATFNGSISNNNFDLLATMECIRMGAEINIVCVGNNCKGERIQHTTGGGTGPVANVLGYDETGGGGGQELNLNAVYV